jgi:hypothetical protein
MFQVEEGEGSMSGGAGDDGVMGRLMSGKNSTSAALAEEDGGSGQWKWEGGCSY